MKIRPRAVDVFLRNNTMFFVPVYEIATRHSVEGSFCVDISLEKDDEEIADVVDRVLQVEISKDDLYRDKNELPAAARATRVKSWGAFVKGVKMVSVIVAEGEFWICTTVNRGNRGFDFVGGEIGVGRWIVAKDAWRAKLPVDLRTALSKSL